MARMSRPIMSNLMVGAIAAIIAFMLTSSGTKARQSSGDDDPGCVAGAAMDRAADGLLPQRRDEFLVRAQPQLPVGEDISRRPNTPM
jgi:hypothetical protein